LGSQTHFASCHWAKARNKRLELSNEILIRNGMKNLSTSEPTYCLLFDGWVSNAKNDLNIAFLAYHMIFVI
jgi:hypothetical protein